MNSSNVFLSMNFFLLPKVIQRIGVISLIGLITWGASGLRAAPLPQASWLASVGTTWRQPSGQDWSYLLYQSSDGTAFANRVVAVYRKDGEPSSPGVYTRQAVTRLQDNPAVIAPLLDRSVNVGEDLNELAEHVTSLFQSLIPAPAVSLPERMAAVVQGLNADPSLHSRVLLLSRRHPGAALAFGMAWTEPLPTGITAFTYELREFDPVAGEDRAVLGRVTIRPGSPLVLPAPGVLVDVPTNSPKADLLARLRWSTPDALRRLNPAQMGFNVYRIPSAVAQNLGFLTNTPLPGVLAGLARVTNVVERVNRQPVVPPKEFSAAEVGNLILDPDTVFITDNRNRHLGGPGFQDGDRYCYFVAARDVLGRDGQYSPVLCVTMCDRVSPSAPRGVKVANDYLIEGATGVQRLRVNWEPAEEAGPQKVARYAVFRWEDRNAMHEDHGKALPIAFVNHRPGTNRFTFVDRTPTAPTVLADAGKVFWYTVRAVQDTACGPLMSANSAPARGIPRDRVGPKGSAPLLTVREPELNLRSQAIRIEGGGTNLPTNGARYVLRATRTNREIAWVEIKVADKSLPGGLATLGRHFFPPVTAPSYASHATAATFNSMEWNFVSTNKTTVTNVVTFGLANGIESKQFFVSVPAPPPGNFSGGVQMDLSVAWKQTNAGPGHLSHTPRDIIPEMRAAGGTVHPVPVTFTTTADTEQWRLYRRLDDGPLAMLGEGVVVPTAGAGRAAAPAGTTTVGYEDDSMPINVAGARYYTQYLDADGNAGPLIGSVVISISTPPPPASVLSLIAGDGGTNDPSTTMTLTWSAAPYGTARYRIWIGNPDRQGAPVMIAIAGLGTTASGSATRREARPSIAAPAVLDRTYALLPAVYRDFVTASGITNLPCTVIDTTVLGSRMGVGPVFSNLLHRASVSADLYVLIEAVALDGTVGVASAAKVLPAGSGAVSTNKLVDWPRRPLPPTRSDFTTATPGFAAVRIKSGNLDGTGDGDFNGIGVAIGTASITAKAPFSPAIGRDAWLNGSVDPDDALFKDAETSRPILGKVITTGTTQGRLPFLEMPVFLVGQPAISAVLYRRQVPSATFPQPSGDLVQVTPMIDGIDHKVYTDPILTASPLAIPATQITDPFIGVFPYGGSYGVFLLDTQPVISGASYEYFLVRFDDYGEMIEVLPTNTVTATP